MGVKNKSLNPPAPARENARGESGGLSAAGIRPLLCGKAKASADKIRVYKTLESTNRTAKELAADGAEHGTVILSERQTDGYGRRGRAFFSPEGGLFMSFVLRPSDLKNPAELTFYAAVSVCEAIEATAREIELSGVKPEIKWVNDIFCDGKKVCGILTEAVTAPENGSPLWAVLGIGLNANAAPDAFPPEIAATAGTPFKGQTVDLNKLAAKIVNAVLTPPPPAPRLFAAYESRLTLLGKKITVLAAESYPALALGIDGAGRLTVKKENGELAYLSCGEVSVRLN